MHACMHRSFGIILWTQTPPGARSDDRTETNGHMSAGTVGSSAESPRMLLLLESKARDGPSRSRGRMCRRPACSIGVLRCARWRCFSAAVMEMESDSDEFGGSVEGGVRARWEGWRYMAVLEHGTARARSGRRALRESVCALRAVDRSRRPCGAHIHLCATRVSGSTQLVNRKPIDRLAHWGGTDAAGSQNLRLITRTSGVCYTARTPRPSVPPAHGPRLARLTRLICDTVRSRPDRRSSEIRASSIQGPGRCSADGPAACGHTSGDLRVSGAGRQAQPEPE